MGGGSQVLSGGNQPGGGGSVSAPARQVSNLIHFLSCLGGKLLSGGNEYLTMEFSVPTICCTACKSLA